MQKVKTTIETTELLRRMLGTDAKRLTLAIECNYWDYAGTYEDPPDSGFEFSSIKYFEGVVTSTASGGTELPDLGDSPEAEAFFSSLEDKCIDTIRENEALAMACDDEDFVDFE